MCREEANLEYQQGRLLLFCFSYAQDFMIQLEGTHVLLMMEETEIV